MPTTSIIKSPEFHDECRQTVLIKRHYCFHFLGRYTIILAPRGTYSCAFQDIKGLLLHSGNKCQ